MSALVGFIWSVYMLIVQIGQPTLLNPVELVWSQLKSRLKNQVFGNLEELTAAVLNQVKQLRTDTMLMKAFFRKREIGFITD